MSGQLDDLIELICLELEAEGYNYAARADKFGTITDYDRGFLAGIVTAVWIVKTGEPPDLTEQIKLVERFQQARGNEQT